MIYVTSHNSGGVKFDTQNVGNENLDELVVMNANRKL